MRPRSRPAASHLARAIERSGAARALYLEMDALLPSSADYFAHGRANLPLGLGSVFPRVARRLRVPMVRARLRAPPAAAAVAECVLCRVRSRQTRGREGRIHENGGSRSK